jgi:hypothetical protein
MTAPLEVVNKILPNQSQGWHLLDANYDRESEDHTSNLSLKCLSEDRLFK